MKIFIIFYSIYIIKIIWIFFFLLLNSFPVLPSLFSKPSRSLSVPSDYRWITARYPTEHNKILIKFGEINLPLRVFRPPGLNFQPGWGGRLWLDFCIVTVINTITDHGSIPVINYLHPPFIWELFLLNSFSSTRWVWYEANSLFWIWFILSLPREFSPNLLSVQQEGFRPAACPLQIPGIIFPWEPIPFASLEIIQRRASQTKTVSTKTGKLWSTRAALSTDQCKFMSEVCRNYCGTKTPFACLEKALEYPRISQADASFLWLCGGPFLQSFAVI